MASTPENGEERMPRTAETRGESGRTAAGGGSGHSWVVPAPLATAEIQMADGTSIILRRHGNPDGRRIITSHGNGFAVDAYYPFWSLLLDRFDVVVYDCRNHGWNQVGDRGVHNVPTLVRDKASVVRGAAAHFGEKPAVGVFHSLSALTALLQVVLERDGSGFEALVLFDPPICPPSGSLEDLEITGQKLAERARHRRDSFEHPEEFAARLCQSRSFERLRPGVAGLFARSTLRRTGTRYRLRCPPVYEAQIYEYFWGWTTEVDFGNLPCPVKVIGADPTVPFSFMPSLDLSTLVQLDYDFVPETTHLLLLENPEACTASMLEFLAGLGWA